MTRGMDVDDDAAFIPTGRWFHKHHMQQPVVTPAWNRIPYDVIVRWVYCMGVVVYVGTRFGLNP